MRPSRKMNENMCTRTKHTHRTIFTNSTFPIPLPVAFSSNFVLQASHRRSPFWQFTHVPVFAEHVWQSRLLSIVLSYLMTLSSPFYSISCMSKFFSFSSQYVSASAFVFSSICFSCCSIFSVVCYVWS